MYNYSAAIYLNQCLVIPQNKTLPSGILHHHSLVQYFYEPGEV